MVGGKPADHCPHPVDAVDVLGPSGVTLWRSGVELGEFRRSHVPAAIIAVLAAEPSGVHVDKIRAVVETRGIAEPKNTMHAHVSLLRKKFGVPIITIGGGYTLDPCLRVDTFAFIEAVDRCPEPATAQDLDPLLRTWQSDPRTRQRIADQRWFVGTALFRARAALIRRVHALNPAERDRMVSLADFAALFSDDPEVAAIRPAPTLRRPRVVVVEDQIMEVIVEGLPNDVDYVRISSWEHWQRFVRGGGLDDVQGVLVDLHLTPDLNDSRGLLVAEDLRDRSEIPVVLMSIAPLANQKAHYATHRLLAIVYKGHGTLNWGELRQAVRSMVDADDVARLERLRTNLDYCEYRVEYHHRLPDAQLRRFRHTVHRVRTTIGEGDPAVAQRAVDEVWTTWLQR